jgi:non-heme Fe2+,alpha-ketoglutarate-dependent halogenase
MAGWSIAERFERDGCAHPIRVLTEAEARAACTEYARFQALCVAHLGAEQRFKGHLLALWLDRIVHHPAILDVVETILGPDILCWSSDFFVKPPQSRGFVSWHQDSTYAGLSPVDRIVNCWLALSPALPVNGCLQAVRGTHRLGQLAHENTHSPDNMLFFGQTARIEIDPARVVSMALEPGEMSLHHMAVVHGSLPNLSPIPRVGLVLRYVAAEVRQAKARDSATLVRGADRFGHFDLEPRPAVDFGPAEIAAFRAAIGRPSGLG